MALSGLSATAEVSRGGYRSPERRTPQEPPVPQEPSPPAEAAPATPLPDAAFYAGRFRAGLTQLGLPAEPENAEPSESQGDPALFDFFGNLSVLLVAVRSGDLARAQAAADALEMEVLVERSAGRQGEPTSAHRIEDLSRLFAAAPPREGGAVRVIAKEIAAERAATPPPAEPLRTLGATPAAASPPPDPYAELGPDAGGAAYDTLSHYFDAEARVV